MGAVQSQMGTYDTGTKSSSIQQQLKYQVRQDSQIFGNIKIYRHCHPPYPYFIKAQISLPSNNQNTENKINLLNQIIQHDNNVQIHNLKVNQNFVTCGKSIKIQFFCKYYTFTLQDAIILRKKNTNSMVPSNNQEYKQCITNNYQNNNQQKRQLIHRLSKYKYPNNSKDTISISQTTNVKQNYFLSGDLWYTLCSLVSYAKQYHQQFKCQFEKFSIKKIFLSPEGLIKIYQFIHLFHDRQVVCCLQEPADKTTSNMTEKQFLLTTRSRNQKKFLKQLQKNSDIFDIGIVMLSLLCLQDISILCNKPDRYSQLQKIILSLQNLGIYDYQLVNVVRKMLEPQYQRVSIDELMFQLPKLNKKSINYKNRKEVQQFMNENSYVNHRFTMHKPASKVVINSTQSETRNINNHKVNQTNTDLFSQIPQINIFSIDTPQISPLKQNKYK